MSYLLYLLLFLTLISIVMILAACIIYYRGKKKKNMSVRKCPKCGQIASDDISFCTKCGTPLE